MRQYSLNQGACHGELEGVEAERDAGGPARLEPEKKDHAELAKVVEAADHARRGDGRADARQKDIRDDQKVRHVDMIGGEEDPVEEGDAQPDYEGEHGVQGELAPVPEEAQPVDELAEEPENDRTGLFGQGLEDESDDAQGAFPEEIKEQDDDQDGRGDPDADESEDGQSPAGLFADGPGRSEERPGDE